MGSGPPDATRMILATAKASGGGPRKGMVDEAVKSYRVAYERDESGWWVPPCAVSTPATQQSRTVDEARRRIREALELFVDDARRAPIGDDAKLPRVAARAIRAYATLRRRPTTKTHGQPARLDAPSASSEAANSR